MAFNFMTGKVKESYDPFNPFQQAYYNDPRWRGAQGSFNPFALSNFESTAAEAQAVGSSKVPSLFDPALPQIPTVPTGAQPNQPVSPSKIPTNMSAGLPQLPTVSQDLTSNAASVGTRVVPGDPLPLDPYQEYGTPISKPGAYSAPSASYSMVPDAPSASYAVVPGAPPAMSPGYNYGTPIAKPGMAGVSYDQEGFGPFPNPSYAGTHTPKPIDRSRPSPRTVPNVQGLEPIYLFGNGGPVNLPPSYGRGR